MGAEAGPARPLPPAWTQEGWHARLAEAGNTTHELMAISGHKTLAEVERYTKRGERQGARHVGHGEAARRAQTGNGQVTNLAAQTYNPPSNALK